jgi:hypothetical protein
MKVEDTISMLQKLRKEDSDKWRAAVENGREKERSEESLASDYFMHSSIEKERQLLDEKRGMWITRRMEMITNETKERLLGIGVECRINKQAAKLEKKSPEKIEEMLVWEQYYMELLLVCEVREWEQLFWNKFKAFLDLIGNDRLEEKDRLTREWRANCWKRLDPQMHSALKRLNGKHSSLETVSLEEQWVECIRLFFEGVEDPDLILVSGLRDWIQYRNDSDGICLRMENEFEDTDFRLKRGSDLGRFDQFWDDDILFECRYSRSKWLDFDFVFSFIRPAPLEVYSHALKGNKNIIHITFGRMDPNFDVNRLLCDLPLVTSIFQSVTSVTVIQPGDPLIQVMPTVTIHRDRLFIESSNNDLNTFAENFRPESLDDSTYIFTDAKWTYSKKLKGNARVLISFVGPTSGKSLILRLEHSGKEDGPLEVTLGSTKIQLNPSSKSSLTIDYITLYPIHWQIPGPSESDHLSFEPEVRNDIVIQFIGPDKFHGHLLHDIELLDEDGLEYLPHSASLSKPSN